MRRQLSKIPFVALLAATAALAQPPTATIRNAQLTATLQLPDSKTGYYRGTRFDWSGILSSLRFKDHDYITAWSQANDPKVADYEYRAEQIVTGPNTTMVGFPEEFLSLPARTAVGWEEAAAGGTFIKIGVGVLRKPDGEPYDHFRSYEMVGKNPWRVSRTSRSVTFVQTVNDPTSGYAYIYTKIVSLLTDSATLTIAHTLKNTGTKSLTGMVYDHNFMRWDHEAPGPDYSLQFAFDVKPAEPLGEMPLMFGGRSVNFSRALGEREAMRALPVGFGGTSSDYDFRIENRKLHTGLRITADQPLSRATLWGIRTVFALEPFISYDIAPGSDFSWTYHYQAYVPVAR